MHPSCYPLVFCHMPYEAAQKLVTKVLSDYLSATKGRLVQVKASTIIYRYHGFKPLGGRKRFNPHPLDLAVVASVMKDLMAAGAVVSDGNGGRWRFRGLEKRKNCLYFYLEKV
ncbi:MAG: hypothetical protein QW407_03695 [Thermofilaceae archaeon]